MKLTTTLFSLLSSELMNTFFNDDTLDNHQIITYTKDLRHFSKILKYDDDVKQVARNTIFYALDIKEDIRERFEKEFLTRFINRSFLYQTYEVSNSYLIQYVSSNKELIEALYNAQDYLTSKTESTNTQSGTSEGRNNVLNADLPQTQVNINLDVDAMAYANDTSISKSSNFNNSGGKSNSWGYSFTNLDTLKALKLQVWEDLDDLLFSQLF